MKSLNKLIGNTPMIKLNYELEREKRNIYVYKCILSHTNFGDVLDCLYVSADEQNWQYEREQLQNDGIVDSYCINLSDSYCNEFGCIEINGVNGGLARVN